jgi:hypothetical protein
MTACGPSRQFARRGDMSEVGFRPEVAAREIQTGALGPQTPEFRRPTGVGVGQSLALRALRTGPTFTQGFFSRTNKFWHEQSDRVVTSKFRPEQKRLLYLIITELR